MSSSVNHLAIIMDGNGRWASQRKRPRVFGHIKGARVAKRIITECTRQKIASLTLYTFSTENWLRPETEVQFLMRLLHRHIRKERKSLIEENIVFKCIGEISSLPENVQVELEKTIEATKNNTGLVLTFALSYGGRQEITSAVKKIAGQVADGQLNLSEIDVDMVEKNLQTYPLPDPDLVIRTSGESRISNFLLWQTAYSELYFTEKLWPEFTSKDLDLALQEFSQRDRRFGQVHTDDVAPTERPLESSP